MQDDTQNGFFTEFCWAVPKAFRDALAACRFEPGDTLYDTARAYDGTWSEALPHITHSIQIRSLGSGGAVISNENLDSAFSENWRQAVVLDLTEYPSRITRSMTTRQGRVYTMLWTGDLSVLAETSPEPPVPRLPQEFLRDLQTSVPWFLDHYGRKLERPVLFIFPLDGTRHLLLAKSKRIQASLSEAFAPILVMASASEVELPNASAYVPTSKVACFIIDTDRIDEVFLKLKQALYVPAVNKKTEAERFRLEAHGFMHPKPN